jgi:hypothetical protein
VVEIASFFRSAHTHHDYCDHHEGEVGKVIVTANLAVEIASRFHFSSGEDC